MNGVGYRFAWSGWVSHQAGLIAISPAQYPSVDIAD
jgi:hypothetical protein